MVKICSKFMKITIFLFSLTIMFGLTATASDKSTGVVEKRYNSFALEAKAKMPAYSGKVTFTAKGALGMCRFCYGTADVYCQGNKYYGSRYFHGRCPVNVFYASPYAICRFNEDCGVVDYNYGTDHECQTSHTGCHIGVVNICRFRP